VTKYVTVRNVEGVIRILGIYRCLILGLRCRTILVRLRSWALIN
jgi:hypothetical protein